MLPEWFFSNFITRDKDDAEWVDYGIKMAEEGR